MTFDCALVCLKSGNRVRRTYWNDEKYLVFIEGSDVETTKMRNNYQFPSLVPTVHIRSHIDLVDGIGITCGYCPTNVDLLAEDWVAL